MSKAVYPGSFNPFHKGHLDVLLQALKVFDKVTIMVPYNAPYDLDLVMKQDGFGKRIEVDFFKGLLVEALRNHNEAKAVIRGMRNEKDFEFEQTMLYWNQDLGLSIPTLYFISDRSLVHVSSSAIRRVDKARE